MNDVNSSTSVRLLNDNWRFREVRLAGASPDSALPWLPAQVPGHVHIDLQNAGVIPDPFERMAERGVQWVDDVDWIYETTFHLDRKPAEHTLLLFEGLDTIAEISLNEQRAGQTQNMFIAHEFSVGPLLRYGPDADGDNVLRVTFRAANDFGRKQLDLWQKESGEEFAEVPYWWGPRSFVRKAQYMYGWDWGPMLASCGIWRPVKLVEVPTARLLDWKYDVEFHDNGTASVAFEFFVDRAPNAADTPINVSVGFVRCGNEAHALAVPLPSPIEIAAPSGVGRVSATVVVTIDDAQRWWPNRHNPSGSGIHPTLYTVEIGLLAEGVTIDSRTAKIGLRTIELVQEADADGEGESFKFRVNGHDIFVKGANWIPSDSFPSRLENEPGKLDSGDLSDDRVYNLIWTACDAGYNMLRVWGGGLYESEHFYELCDEHGILVWQDFTYGCAYYPDTGKYVEPAREEAIAAVRRIRVHPSLAIWCGNNENNWMFHSRWGGVVPSRLLGEHLYHDILPPVIGAEDSNRPYWPSSPFGGDDPNAQNQGDRHNWDVWGGANDWIRYAECSGRFISEFGFAASCTLAAWNTCLNLDDRSAYSDAVKWHDKTRNGYHIYMDLVKLHYPEMETLEDLVYYTQLNQADALKYGIEHYRRQKGHCWGTMFWQINDCWPVQSWAVIDSELQPKAAFFASKRFYAPILLSFRRNESSVEGHVTNDTLAPISGTATISLKTFAGEILTETTLDAGVDTNATRLIGSLNLDAAREFEADVYVVGILRGSNGERAGGNFMFLTNTKDLRLPEPKFDIDIQEQDADTLIIALQADTFAASVWLFVDAQDGEIGPEFSDNFFHMEAGETRVVEVGKTSEIATAGELRDALRVRTLYGEI